MTTTRRGEGSAAQRAAARWQLDSTPDHGGLAARPGAGLAARPGAGLVPARTRRGGEYVITGVVAGVRDLPPVRRRWWRSGWFWLTTAAAAAAGAVGVGVVWLVVLAVAALVAAVSAVVSAVAAAVAWVAAHWVWIALGLGALLLLGARGCRGLHCRGCRG
jgi:hypothetical protein